MASRSWTFDQKLTKIVIWQKSSLGGFGTGFWSKTSIFRQKCEKTEKKTFFSKETLYFPFKPLGKRKNASDTRYYRIPKKSQKIDKF